MIGSTCGTAGGCTCYCVFDSGSGTGGTLLILTPTIVGMEVFHHEDPRQRSLLRFKQRGENIMSPVYILLPGNRAGMCSQPPPPSPSAGHAQSATHLPTNVGEKFGPPAVSFEVRVWFSFSGVSRRLWLRTVALRLWQRTWVDLI